jgi:predicted nucleic acid-binding protein
MNLDDIPRGSFCVLDTNILIYAEQRASHQTERLIRRIEDVTGVLAQPVWQETMRRLAKSGAKTSREYIKVYGNEIEKRIQEI